jgi:hypothetical protein
MAAQPDVMPRWSAMPASGASLFTSNQFWVRAIVRVPAGTNGPESALVSALRAEFAKLPGATPEEIPQVTVRLLPGGRGLDSLRKDTERPLAILGAVVAVVLLMACANLAALMLARRCRQRGSRCSALGAGKAQLIHMPDGDAAAPWPAALWACSSPWTGPVVASMVTVGLGAADVIWASAGGWSDDGGRLIAAAILAASSSRRFGCQAAFG